MELLREIGFNMAAGVVAIAMLVAFNFVIELIAAPFIFAAEQLFG